jgi:hypothetical protein
MGRCGSAMHHEQRVPAGGYTSGQAEDIARHGGGTDGSGVEEVVRRATDSVEHRECDGESRPSASWSSDLSQFSDCSQVRGSARLDSA